MTCSSARLPCHMWFTTADVTVYTPDYTKCERLSIVQDGVTYLLDAMAIRDNVSVSTFALLDSVQWYGVVLHFPTNAITIESKTKRIIYDAKTIKNIEAKTTLVREQLLAYAAGRLTGVRSVWEAASVLNTLWFMRSMLPLAGVELPGMRLAPSGKHNMVYRLYINDSVLKDATFRRWNFIDAQWTGKIGLQYFTPLERFPTAFLIDDGSHKTKARALTYLAQLPAKYDLIRIKMPGTVRYTAMVPAALCGCPTVKFMSDIKL